MINTRYCVLPSGNSDEFHDIDLELTRRKINANILLMKSGGRIYEIPKPEIKKLPKDSHGFYLGDDNSGHSIYTLSESEYNTYTAGGTWVTLAQLIGNQHASQTCSNS